MEAYKYLESSGVVVPDTANVRAEVEAEYKAVFGTDIDVSPETPQGQLITIETAARITFIKNNAALANQINPNLAGGVNLDAILALTGSERKEAVNSSAVVDCTGVAGTIIVAGSEVRNIDTGELFALKTEIVLDVLGTASGAFIAVEDGPIPAEINTLIEIVDAIIGWETATNPAAATLGTLAGSDIVTRDFRKQTLALQGRSTPIAIQSALTNIPGVIGPPSFIENVEWTPEVIDGVSMVPKSIYVCVDGGDDVEVATVLVAKKSEGAAFNNGAAIPVEVDVTAAASGQVYVVKFDRPTLITILVRVTILANTAVDDPEKDVKAAILAYAAGELDGEEGLIIGADVSAFELGGAVNCVFPRLYVRKVEISLVAPLDYSDSEITIEKFEKADITEANIAVIIV